MLGLARPYIHIVRKVKVSIKKTINETPIVIFPGYRNNLAINPKRRKFVIRDVVNTDKN